MRSTHVRGVLLASCLVVMGCVDHVVRPCDLWVATAIVSGRVTDSSGAAIVDAVLEIQVASTGRCHGAEDWAHSKRVTTDANGDYSTDVALGNSRGIRCVSVTEAESGTSAQGAVEFVGGCDDSRPPGRLNVDLIIP